jgi:hypothetical protein
MLVDLRLERDHVDEAIMVLERLLYGQGKRRGRPPKWMTQAAPNLTTKCYITRPERSAPAQEKGLAVHRRVVGSSTARGPSGVLDAEDASEAG